MEDPTVTAAATAIIQQGVLGALLVASLVGNVWLIRKIFALYQERIDAD